MTKEELKEEITKQNEELYKICTELENTVPSLEKTIEVDKKLSKHISTLQSYIAKFGLIYPFEKNDEEILSHIIENFDLETSVETFLLYNALRSQEKCKIAIERKREL